MKKLFPNLQIFTFLICFLAFSKPGISQIIEQGIRIGGGFSTFTDEKNVGSSTLKPSFAIQWFVDRQISKFLSLHLEFGYSCKGSKLKKVDAVNLNYLNSLVQFNTIPSKSNTSFGIGAYFALLLNNTIPSHISGYDYVLNQFDLGVTGSICQRILIGKEFPLNLDLRCEYGLLNIEKGGVPISSGKSNWTRNLNFQIGLGILLK